MSAQEPTLADFALILKRIGLSRLYLTPGAAHRLDSAASAEMKQTAAAPKSGQTQPFIRSLRKPDEKVVGEKRERLDTLELPLRECQACRLCQSRTNLVYGVGNPDADLLFIGEGPGRDEDLQGEPFVGRAGQLLTDMIVKGLKIRREDVYIANIVKCRPPQNRNPEPDEMEACLPNLLQQIQVIQPRVIVTLGAVPAKALFRERTGITRLRGNWRWLEGVPVMPTLHPAYLLRNPAAKKDVWDDLKEVIALLNGELKLPQPPSQAESALF